MADGRRSLRPLQLRGAATSPFSARALRSPGGEERLAGGVVAVVADAGERHLRRPARSRRCGVPGAGRHHGLPPAHGHGPADLGELPLQVVQEVGRADQVVARRPWRGGAHRGPEDRVAAVARERSVTGLISLLWRDVDPYEGPVVLLTLDADDPRDQSTFEVRGALAGRLGEGALQEGMRVRVDCRSETVEVV